MGEYIKKSILGTGTFGRVYKAKSPTGENVAVKRIYCPTKKRLPGIISIKELQYNLELRHPYIANCITVLHTQPFSDTLSPKRKHKDDTIYLVYDLATYDLQKLIYTCNTPISHMKRGMYQLLSGLYYLHHNNISHRDIKPNNILCYYNNGYVTMKIADLGTAKPLNNLDKASTYVGCMIYKAPELLLENEFYDAKIDVWALGCVFYEMISKKILFDIKGNNPRKTSCLSQLTTVFSILGVPSTDTLLYLSEGRIPKIRTKGLKITSIENHLSYNSNKIKLFNEPIVNGLDNGGSYADFMDLLYKMLKIDPRERITSWEALQHPFFANIISRDADGNEIQKQEPLIKSWHYLEIQDCDTRRYLYDLAWRCTFDTIRLNFIMLDIIDRIIVKQGNAITYKKKEAKLLITTIAIMVSKYFLAEDSPPPKELVPWTCTWKYEIIQKKELFLLETLLDYIVYRETVYDCLMKNKNENIEPDYELLFNILRNHDVNGIRIDILAEKFAAFTY